MRYTELNEYVRMQTQVSHDGMAADAPEEALVGSLLKRLPTYLNNAWVALDERRGYFGDPGSDENGIRTNTNVAFAAAVVGTQGGAFGIDEAAAASLRERCKASLRYLAESHLSAGGRCANAGQWGLEWQSAWWSAKLASAARLLWRELPADLQAAVERVVAAEADRQLPRIVPTGLHLDTKAEENAWDAEILAAAIALLPGHPRRARWHDKLIEISANVFSSPHDRTSDKSIDGRPARELIYTCNLHGDYSLENHGAYHFCYVASPLLSKAWCAYALQSIGSEVPQAVMHGVSEVWALARHTFLDHRFAYISGQDWARYTYGEYFIVPALVFLEHSLADGRCTEILRARLELLWQEAQGNSDGSFFGGRFTAGRFGGQYGKYETDCFACLALAWMLRRQPAPPLAPHPQPRHRVDSFQHVSPEAQFCFQRTPQCFFSFSWSTLDEMVPNLCMIPAGRDDLAEWHSGNLIGAVAVPGHHITIGVRAMKSSEAGIEIAGSCLIRSMRGKPLVEHLLDIRFDARSASASIHSRFVARTALRRVSVTGVNLRIPNDLFNGHRRRLRYEGGERWLETTPAQRDPLRNRDRRGLARRIAERLLRGVGRDNSTVERVSSNWLNVDDALGLVVQGEPTISIRRFSGRQSTWGSLFVEQIEAPARRFFLRRRAGDVLLDTTVVVHVGSAQRTAAIARGEPPHGAGPRAVG